MIDRKYSRASLISLSSGVLAAVSCVGASQAFAQSPAAPQSANAAADEITVTARIREEPLQDVPIQITVFTAENIVDAGLGPRKNSLISPLTSRWMIPLHI